MTHPDGREPAETLLYLVRHGVTEWNIERRFQGHLDIPLSAEGLRQARAVASWLRSRGIDFSAVYTSNLTRALQTAEAIGDALGIAPTIAQALREIHCGEWQGLSVDEVEARYPGKLKEWHDSIACFTLPRGESIPQVQARVYSFYLDAVRKHAGEAVILVSHGVALSALHAAIFGWDLQETWDTHRARLGNTGVSVVAVDANTGVPTSILMNSSEHLPAPTGMKSVLDQPA